MEDYRAEALFWKFRFTFFITPSRKQNMFVNLPVGDSSPPVLIPGENFLEEMYFH